MNITRTTTALTALGLTAMMLFGPLERRMLRNRGLLLGGAK